MITCTFTQNISLCSTVQNDETFCFIKTNNAVTSSNSDDMKNKTDRPIFCLLAHSYYCQTIIHLSLVGKVGV
jgi:hypothetical protein